MPEETPKTVAEAVLAQRGPVLFEGRRIEPEELLAAACARAALLRELLPPGAEPHVAVLLDNGPEYVHWLQACALAGAALIGVNPTRRGPDLVRDLHHTDGAVLVTERRLLPLLPLPGGAGADGLGGRFGPRGERVLVTDSPEYERLLSGYRGADPPPASALPGPDTRMLLTFTSGSTGAPKAVVCGQGRLVRAGEKLRGDLRLTAADTGYGCMPFFHGNALMGLWSPMLLAGGAVVLRRRFSASGFLPDVRRYGISYFTYVGRTISYLLAVPEAEGERETALRLGFGTEAGKVDAERFERRFGCRLIEGYGSSEGGCNLRREPDAPAGALGRTGSAPGDDLAVVDPETGEECPRSRFDEHGRLLNGDEAIGELVNRRARTGFEGYWRNAEAERRRVRNGWYWTGDLFHRDEDGWFRFAGRSADWLRVDSENLAVADIENILARWPEARSVAVYAVPDPVAGDQVMAAVQPAEGAWAEGAWAEGAWGEGAPGEAAVAELGERLGRFLAGQPDLGTKMAPRFVRLMVELPVTATLKVARARLRAEGWDVPERVLWRPYGDRGDGGYRELTSADREAVRALFAEHGR
ncbi:AMP-binding protein [Phaeacidiphilus oryzae]|uniref:AMP-binding protein n=1 Tax=Phaeacidiphilus oryzae TaxID=348818 RepID=UPI000568099B|nr:AMP-binding protein [Phaeacidiphilus oryzae]